MKAKKSKSGPSRLKFLVASTKKIDNPLYAALASGWGDVVVNADFDPKAGYSAVVFDAAQLKPADMEDPKKVFAQVADAKVPILLLDPTKKHKEALRKYVPVVAGDASHAFFFAPQPSTGGIVTRVRELVTDYTVPQPESRTKPCEQCPDRAKPKKLVTLKSPKARVSKDLTQDSILDFGMAMRDDLQPSAPTGAAQDTPPTGLKYFRVPYSRTYPMSPNTSPGGFTVSSVFWGFLNESPTTKFQILVVENTNSGGPGNLNRNDDEERGWLTNYYRQANSPQGSFSWMKNIPSTSGNPVTQSFTIDIDYKDPIGGWSIWEFTASINDSIPGWKVVNETSGVNVKNAWAMAEPVDGLRAPETGKDAFDFWGWVKPMPEMSTGSINVHAAAAWRAGQIYTGNVNFNSSVDVQFGKYRCKSKAIGLCWEDEWSWWGPWAGSVVWSLNFAPIT